MLSSPIAVIALAFLAGCGEASFECAPGEGAPVSVALYNADTGRRISDATVTAGDGINQVELVETMRGEYATWADLPGMVVHATHPDYFEETATLTYTFDECAPGWVAMISMHRKSPCNMQIAGVEVKATDGVDGAPVGGAQIDLRDGVYSERMIETTAGLYRGAFDRPGIYLVDVHASGYREAIQESVWVAEDDCTVLTSSITVALQRS